MSLRAHLFLTVAVLAAAAPSAHAQSNDGLQALIRVSNAYRVSANVTYLKASGTESKLDIYQSRMATGPQPTLVWIHGGNWVGGSKEASTTSILPFLALGWNVVNVEYRLLATAPAPAAAEDCYCALRWVVDHANDYNIDPSRIVTSGNSAGGHLALLVASASPAAGLDRLCSGGQRPAVSAVVNWYGFPDLEPLLDGEDMRPAVQAWIGYGANRAELARRLSPSAYVNARTPPVFSVHGDADPTSPFRYEQQYHEALSRAGVPNELFTVKGGKHGGFSDVEMEQIFGAMRTFLARPHAGSTADARTP
jgi:acetyl esterase/lipase